MLVIDSLSIHNKSWDAPTIFPRIFGLAVVEDIIFGFLLVYQIILFYEYFFDKGSKEIINSKMKYFVGLLLLIFSIFVFFLRFNSLRIPYFYFWSGLVLLVFPTILFLYFKKKMIRKFVKTGLYFFVLSLIFEMTGLYLKQWHFLGNEFIALITIFSYTFPIEEFIYWFILFAIAILSYFEFFDDDMK